MSIPDNRAALELAIAAAPEFVAASTAAMRAPILSWAAELMGEKCPEHAQPVLDAAWAHEQSFVREGAVLGAEAMRRNGAETPASAAILAAATADPNATIRGMASAALEVW